MAPYLELYERLGSVTRVSVVMPAFDAEATLGAAISSALWQTYTDLELVVVDDGSTRRDRRDRRRAPGARARGRRQENAGVAAARNRGIAEARGELIAFCDADDVFLPGHLEALVETFDRNGGGIATSNCYWLFPGGIHPSRMRYKGGFPAAERQRLAILEQNFVSTMSLFPSTLADEIGPFDPELAVRRGLGLLAARDLRGPPRGAAAAAARALSLGLGEPLGRASADGRARRGGPPPRRRARRPDARRSALTSSGASPAPVRAHSVAAATRRSAPKPLPRGGARRYSAPRASARASRDCSGRPARCGSPLG